MAHAQSLFAFVEASLKAGQDPDSIRNCLTEAGWAPARIERAIAAYSPTPWGIPVPVAPVSSTARDTFFYIGLFVAFYISMGWFISLSLNLVDYYTSKDITSWKRNGILNGFAWVMVFSPVYLWLARYDRRRLQKQPALASAGARQWLTYLTLLVAGLTLLFDSVFILSSYLKGTLLLPTFCKAMIVGFTGALVLVYFRRTLPQDEKTAP